MQWPIVTKKLSELKPWDQNPRTITKKALGDLSSSIDEDGYWATMVIDLDGTIIAGNQTYRALLAKGVDEVQVMVAPRKLTDRERKRINRRANAHKGVDDIDILSAWDVSELLEGWMTEEDVDRMFELKDKSKTVEDDFDTEEAYNKIDKPITQPGDVYMLSDHKIICGDSTDRGTFEKLFGNVKADLIFTDPPYNVDYDYSKYTDGRKMKWDKIFNDNKNAVDFHAFLLQCLKNAYDFTADHASFYVWHADKTALQFWAALDEAGFYVSQRITWVKDRFVLSFGQHFHRMFEPCMHGWKKGKKCYFNKRINNAADVWNLDKEDILSELDLWKVDRDPQKDYIHPTQKPVKLAERGLRKSSKLGNIVLDMFLGSGSTLMACEQMGRTCYGVELDPKYCDVLIQRWEAFTGKKAQKL